MTVAVYRVHTDFEDYPDRGQSELVLAYDPESEEMWGLQKFMRPQYIGLDADEFMHFFRSHRYVAGEVDGDPFEDEIPDSAKEQLVNYPPGSEELPDVETVKPPDSFYEDRAADKAAEAATSVLTKAPEGIYTSGGKWFAVGPDEHSKGSTEYADDAKYPVNNCSDVEDAWGLAGHVGEDYSVSEETVRERIKRAAEAKDCDVPGDSGN